MINKKDILLWLVILIPILVFPKTDIKFLNFQDGSSLNSVLGEVKDAFIELSWKDSTDEKIINLKGISEIEKFMVSYRNKSSWMVPLIKSDLQDLPAESQYFLARLKSGKYLMILPLIDNRFRTSLQGANDNTIDVVIESGDRFTKTNRALALYVSVDNNPHEMIKRAAENISKQLKTFRTRTEKTLPWFVDYLGWCSYNAFYQNVTQENIRKVLNNQKDKQIPVKWLLIDDGMQSHVGTRLNSFEANSIKFPNGLKGLIDMSKNEYSIDKVMVWTALWGYWGGIDPVAFPNNSRFIRYTVPPRYNNLIDKDKNINNKNFEATVGNTLFPMSKVGTSFHIPGPSFTSFYKDYFDYLRLQGVDGVKVDAITWVEGLGDYNRGGRVAMMKDLMDGLQMNSAQNFNGELLNCSSCSNDYFYNTLTANVTRTSGDFFPDKPETHGSHIFVNAHSSFWVGDIITPDWDMFQSGAKEGEFHAAARAISGGPVYTTEKVGTENVHILQALCTSKGKLLRCEKPAKLTMSSLFVDPEVDKKAVTVFSENKFNYVIGAFNCSYKKNSDVIVESVICANDVEGIKGKQFAIYDWASKNIIRTTADKQIKSELSQLKFNIYTIGNVVDGFAPIGLDGKYNPGGAISDFEQLKQKTWKIEMIEGGKLICYSEYTPKEIICEGKNIPFKMNGNKLIIDVPLKENISIMVALK